MAPKAKVEVIPTVPEIEEEVQLPDGVEAPKSSFCIILGHAAGGNFVVEEDPPDDGADSGARTRRDFDPVAELIAKAKQPPESVQDLLSRKVVVVERAELQAFFDPPPDAKKPAGKKEVVEEAPECKNLALALRSRLQKERDARSRAKSNAARRLAIEAHNKAQEPPADGADTAASPVPAVIDGGSQPPKADFVVLVQGYPSNAGEVRELAAEGFVTQGLVDLWATIYFAGETVGSAADGGDEAAIPEGDLPTPPQVLTHYDEIQIAPLGSELADSTIVTVYDSHELLNAQPGEPAELRPVERVQAALFNAVGSEVVMRKKYQKWLEAPKRIHLPAPTPRTSSTFNCETRLYNSLMSSVDPAHHDVPLFLHCLAEQVQLELDGAGVGEGGAAQRLEDSAVRHSLEEYLGAAREDMRSGGRCAAPRQAPRLCTRPPTGPGQSSATAAAVVAEAAAELLARPPAPPVPPEVELLAYLDTSAVAHHLVASSSGAGSGAVPAGAGVQLGDVVGVVRRLLDQVSVPGKERSQFPSSTTHSSGEREALRSRLHPFAPSVSSAALEQLVLQHGFEELMSKAQPERRWHFADRTCREKIRKDHLAQTLASAFQGEPLMDMAYLPRYDCLLVVLHRRSLQGRVMWSAWRGDLLRDSENKEQWLNGLFTIPTYNDWAQVVSRAAPGGEAPQPGCLLEGIDSRQMGYASVTEKLLTPADGSSILVSKLEVGISTTFETPSNRTRTKVMIDNAAAVWESASVASGTTALTVAAGAGTTAASALPPKARYEPVARRGSQVARVMKDGLTFGMVTDGSWRAWCETHEELTGSAAFEGARLGSFWLALPGGSRCTVRMHHETVLPVPGGQLPQRLPSMGVLLTYTMGCGQIVQAFRDGTVRLSWPLHLCHGGKGGGVDGVAKAIDAPNTGANGRCFSPGCAEDVERSRTIMPCGTIVRKLLSGRIEVMHPDGTVAARNPTVEMIEAQFKAATEASFGTERVEILRRLLRAEIENRTRLEAEPSRKPSPEELRAGLPGHWVVIRTDGRIFGRVQAPAEAPKAEDEQQEEGDRPASSPSRRSTLLELLEGQLVEGGDLIEYEIQPVSMAVTQHLVTKQQIFTNDCGLACFMDPANVQKAAVHSDGTQVVRSLRDCGYDVAISKEPYAYVRCEVSTSGKALGARVFVQCADGASLEVVPDQKSNGRGEADIARVSLKFRGGASIESVGDGEVRMQTDPSGRGEGYVAYCHEDRLCLRDADGGEFEVHGDQTARVVSLARFVGEDAALRSPRCSLAAQAYAGDFAEQLELPAQAPHPRLFVIYGDGESEELISESVVTNLLQAARADRDAEVIENQPLISEAENGCVAHTVFRSRVADNALVPMQASVALPDLPAWTPGGAVVPLPAVTEFRQFVQYPPVDEDVRVKFKGTLNQYRKWEMEQRLKLKEALKGPESGKSKKESKEKKAAESLEKKKKEPKGKKGKQAVVVEEVPVVVVEPTFVPDFNMTAFEHEVLALRYRAAQLPDPTPEALLSAALAARMQSARGTPEVERSRSPVAGSGGSSPKRRTSAASTERGLYASQDLDVEVAPDGGEDFGSMSGEGSPKAGSGDGTAIGEELSSNATIKLPLKKPKPWEVKAEEPVFNYFESVYGRAFLEAEGLTGPRTPKVKGASTRQRPQETERGPWNPRLVGEPAPEPATREDDQDGSGSGAKDDDLRAFRPDTQAIPIARAPQQQDSGYPYGRGYSAPMHPEADATPAGPHPDKRGAAWDVYGEEKPPKKSVSQAHIAINADYLEVEGATDRRVRTSSVAQKKNSAKAPSVSSVRKAGLHEVGRTAEMGAKDILGYGGDAEVEEHWKLSSTMQGLGSSECLVDVKPGKCRFGPLRRGSLYRMSFYFRNLDVDVTRYNVCKVKSDYPFVHIDYQPGHLAPGMAAKVVVMIAALAPARIDQLVEVRTKAHVIRVPITARVYDPDEYDRLDSESMALHGTRIGRQYERSEGNKPGPVELVNDEALCRKVMGADYAPFASSLRTTSR